MGVGPSQASAVPAAATSAGEGEQASGLADGSVGFEKAVALNEPQAAPEASAQPKLHMWQARKDIKWIIVNSEPGHLLSCAYFMKQNQ